MAVEVTVQEIHGATQRSLASAACEWLRAQVWLMFFVLVYFGTGCAFYMRVEGWGVWEALYFLMVTASTVGYGDMNPTTGVAGTRGSLAASRIFTILYIFFGICVVFAQLSALIGDVFKPPFRWARAKLESLVPQSGIDIDGDGTSDFKVPRSPLIYYSKNLLAPFLLIIVVQLTFAAIFVAVEPGWDFGTALYHCMVTATTVGYGDVTINTDGGRMWAFFHILISVSLLAALLAQFGELADQRKLLLQKLKLVKGSLDTELMMSLDKDGDGVDKFEFVIGMLTKLELLDEKDVETFVKLFVKMDTDGSGKLTRADIDGARAESEERMASLANAFDNKSMAMEMAGMMPLSTARRLSLNARASVVRGRAVSVTDNETAATVSAEDHL